MPFILCTFNKYLKRKGRKKGKGRKTEEKKEIERGRQGGGKQWVVGTTF
jgi:hypothetical protein